MLNLEQLLWLLVTTTTTVHLFMVDLVQLIGKLKMSQNGGYFLTKLIYIYLINELTVAV